MNRQTFYIKTLGCKVNQYESQVIREGFVKMGYIEADDIDMADICVINTCTVTSKSDSKSLRLIRRAAGDTERCIIATGCMTEARDIDLSMLNGVQFIVKNKDKYRIAEIVGRGDETEGRGQRAWGWVYGAGISGFKGHNRVFVKVQDGCNNTCSYCKVRIVRGRSRSRPLKHILSECERLIKNGSREIVLTGICLGAYGKDMAGGINLNRLISEISKIEGSWRLRLSSIEPKDINKDLMRLFQKGDRLCRHLHIPFQSGDNYILKRMNRPYTRMDYLKIVDRIRRYIPDIAISTDMMVGFPGEGEKNFKNTMDFIKAVGPMRIHVFPFSKRKGTRASYYRDDVSCAAKKEREDDLLHAAENLSMGFSKRFADRQVRVLVEEKRTAEGYLQGYTDTYIKVYINGPDDLKGRLINPLITLTNSKVYGILS